MGARKQAGVSLCVSLFVTSWWARAVPADFLRDGPVARDCLKRIAALARAGISPSAGMGGGDFASRMERTAGGAPRPTPRGGPSPVLPPLPCCQSGMQQPTPLGWDGGHPAPAAPFRTTSTRSGGAGHPRSGPGDRAQCRSFPHPPGWGEKFWEGEIGAGAEAGVFLGVGFQ